MQRSKGGGALEGTDHLNEELQGSSPVSTSPQVRFLDNMHNCRSLCLYAEGLCFPGGQMSMDYKQRIKKLCLCTDRVLFLDNGFKS